MSSLANYHFCGLSGICVLGRTSRKKSTGRICICGVVVKNITYVCRLGNIYVNYLTDFDLIITYVFVFRMYSTVQYIYILYSWLTVKMVQFKAESV
jgi:hypothetical protein